MELIDEEGLSNIEQTDLERIKLRIETKANWYKEMKANEKIQRYFDGFEPESVKQFVGYYLQSKLSWKEHGPFWAKEKETENLQWIDLAFMHLGYIQQKKLFDAQCLWRADQLKIKEVNIGWDFMVWETDILACPFIDPISNYDLDLYVQFLEQRNIKLEDYDDIRWQFYMMIKLANESDGEDGEFPDWYAFSNTRSGKGILMQLPDLRGEKEKFYTGLWHENWLKENGEAWAKANAARSKLPALSYFDTENTQWFIKAFENKEVLQWYTDYQHSHRSEGYIPRTVQENIDLLLTANEPVPIEAHYNWVEAIENAVENYRLKKLVETLPQAFEQYKFMLQAGVGFAEGDGLNWKSQRDQLAKEILGGRKLNGEPEDFDF